MKFLPRALFTLGVISLAGATFAATNATVSPQEKAKIENVVHQYLIEKPEVLVEALQILQKRQFQETEKTVKKTQETAANFAKPLFHQANDPINGNPNGKVTLVEFFDYQCGHCVEMAPVIESITKANPDLRVVYKDFPIRGQLSEYTARVALAANKQGKYNEFSHAILNANQQLTQDLVLQIAEKQGLNMTQLKKDMDDAGVKNQLKTTFKLAQDLKLFGTPALFIGKTDGSKSITYIPGGMNQQQLQDAIDKVANS